MMRLSSWLSSATAFIFLCRAVEGQGDGITVKINETTAAPADETSTNGDKETTAPPAPTPLPPKPDCFDDTTLLIDYIEAKDPFTPEDFVLCPNQIYKLGVVLRPDDTCCLDGLAPLYARSNTRIMCGADGKLENNCTLIGGQFQVTASFFTFSEVVSNAVFQGITFENSAFAGFLLENDGDMTFEDCALKNHSGVAPIIGAHNPDVIPGGRRLKEAQRELQHLTPRQRMAFVTQEHAKRLSREESFFDRFLKEEEYEEHERGYRHRQLQATPSNRMDITLNRCLFENNERGTLGGAEKLGVITSEGVQEHYTVKDCLFRGNEYGDVLDVRGYMIEITDRSSTLDIQGTCFVDNNVIGPGLVLLNSMEVLVGNSNLAITADSDVDCQFVAVETRDEDGQVTGVSCVDPVTSGTCSAPYDVGSDVVFITSAAGSSGLSWMFGALCLMVPVLML